MANCICYNCKRPMDCTGEDLCDVCEVDREQILAGFENANYIWLSQCCDANIYGTFEVTDDTFSGFCVQCLDNTVFYKAFY